MQYRHRHRVDNGSKLRQVGALGGAPGVVVMVMSLHGFGDGQCASTPSGTYPRLIGPPWSLFVMIQAKQGARVEGSRYPGWGSGIIILGREGRGKEGRSSKRGAVRYATAYDAQNGYGNPGPEPGQSYVVGSVLRRIEESFVRAGPSETGMEWPVSRCGRRRVADVLYRSRRECKCRCKCELQVQVGRCSSSNKKGVGVSTVEAILDNGRMRKAGGRWNIPWNSSMCDTPGVCIYP